MQKANSSWAKVGLIMALLCCSLGAAGAEEAPESVDLGRGHRDIKADSVKPVRSVLLQIMQPNPQQLWLPTNSVAQYLRVASRPSYSNATRGVSPIPGCVSLRDSSIVTYQG